MKCSHCGTSHFDNSDFNNFIYNHTRLSWNYRASRCPECEEFTFWIRFDELEEFRMVQPIATARGAVSTHVPISIKQDFIEACNVFPISAKASAALSRRCLQNILNGHGYMGRDLSKQIDALLSEADATKGVGSVLAETIDAIRNFGNFSAHPINDQTTLQIIDVEPEEAEWCLQIIEDMFDHFYERPALAAAKKAALNAKLAAAGKPAAK